jgi:glutamate-1-semialdehyde 2,1-aminomutase
MAAKMSVAYHVNSATAMFTGFFGNAPVMDYESAARSDRRLYEAFFKAMLEEGIFFAPSQFEAAFLTLTYDDTEYAKTLQAFERVFRRIRDLG